MHSSYHSASLRNIPLNPPHRRVNPTTNFSAASQYQNTYQFEPLVSQPITRALDSQSYDQNSSSTYHRTYPHGPIFTPGPVVGNPGTNSAKHKTPRASRVCGSCRTRKQKCDSAQPCASCSRYNTVCKYEDAPPPKNDTIMNDIQHLATEVNDRLNQAMATMSASIECIDRRIPTISNLEPREEAALQSDHTASADQLLVNLRIPEDWYQDIPYLKKLKDEERSILEYVKRLDQDREILPLLEAEKGSGSDDHAQGRNRPRNNNKLMEKERPRSLSSVEEEILDGLYENGLGQDCRLDVRCDVMDELLASYNRYIHTIHPFLDPNELQKMFQGFKEQCNVDAGHENIPSLVEYQLNPGMKRKRVSGARGVLHLDENRIKYSMSNAIVLLVLALGKVCSQLSSSESRNFDKTPSMAYYTRAASILGAQHGGQTIVHAQAFILAALYKGQLVRVSESWNWANQACQIMALQVKQSNNKLHHKTECKTIPETLPQLLIVYWTSFRLESSIVAEMSRLPTTATRTYHGDILYPSNMYRGLTIGAVGAAVTHLWKDADQDELKASYCADIYLRSIMHEAYNKLYARKIITFDPKDEAELYLRMLANWKAKLPPSLDWHGDDEPSTKLHVARLRALYHHTLYLALRPCLQALLALTWEPNYYSYRLDVEEAGLDSKQKEMFEFACVCIKATVQGTIAFDRVGAPQHSSYTKYDSMHTQRLVVDNIFGTMHAQFGYMLTLAAVHHSNMSWYLPKGIFIEHADLQSLLNRTISKLKEVAPSSPPLQIDVEILENARQALNLRSELPR